MSINKFQEKVFRTGCGHVVLYICAAVFFAGMFYLGCGLGAGGQSQNDTEHGNVAFKVGDIPVYYEDFSQQLSAARQQQIQQLMQGRAAPEQPISPDSLPPIAEASIESGVLEKLIQRDGTLLLAERAGVKFTDAQMRQALSKQVEGELMGAKFQAIDKYKLKPGATDAEIDAALKKDKQPTLDEMRKMTDDRITLVLKDPKTRPQVEQSVAQDLLMSALASQFHPSTAELKASFDKFQFKRVLFAAHPGSTVAGEIAKVQSDLKSGASFEQEIDRYSSDPPIKGKRLSEQITDIQPTQFDMTPEYRTLKSMKVGEVSPPIDTPQGKAIYKLIDIINGAPADFAKNPKKYEQSYAMQRAQAEFEDQQKKLSQSGGVTWEMPGLKALYDWSQNQAPAGPGQSSAKMQAVVTEAKDAMAASKGDVRSAALAWYVAFDTLWTAPNADKTKLTPDRIDMLQQVTAVIPNFDLEMELVHLLEDAKKYNEAAQALTNTAQSNTTYDVTGENRFRDVQAEVLKLKQVNGLKPADEKAIAKVQDDWLKAKADNDQQVAEMKKEEQQARQEAAQNAAKQKAEVDKEKAEQKKASQGAAAPKSGAAAGSPAPSKPPTTGVPPSSKKP